MKQKKRVSLVTHLTLLALITLATSSSLLFCMKRKLGNKYSSSATEKPLKKRKFNTNTTQDDLYNIFLQRKKHQTAILYLNPKSCSPIALDLTKKENFIFVKKYLRKNLDISQDTDFETFLYKLFKRNKKYIIVKLPVSQTKSIKKFLELARIRTSEEDLPIKHQEEKHMDNLSQEEITQMLDIESFLDLKPLNSTTYSFFVENYIMQALANKKQVTSPLFLKGSLFDLVIKKIKINILNYFSLRGSKISDYFASIDDTENLKKIVQAEEKQIIPKQNRQMLEHTIRTYEQEYDIYMPNFPTNHIEKINITLQDLIKHNYIDRQILNIIDTSNTDETSQAFVTDIIGNAHLIKEKFHYLSDIKFKHNIYQAIIEAVSHNTREFNTWLYDTIGRQQKPLPERKSHILSFIQAVIKRVFLDMKDPQQFATTFAKLFKTELPRMLIHKIPKIVRDVEPGIRHLYLKRFGYARSLPSRKLFP